MCRLIYFFVFLCLSSFLAVGSTTKDILFSLSKDYSVEMWRQGTNGNPTLEMNKKAYDFYFKHLYDTYNDVYKSAVKTNDTDALYKLYDKVCSLLRWKVENKEYSNLKKYMSLKKKIETYVQSK